MIKVQKPCEVSGMKGFKKGIAVLTAVLLLWGSVACASAATPDQAAVGYGVINVLASDVNSYGFYSAVQRG